MNFYVRINYTGKDLAGQNITIPAGETLEVVDDYVCYNHIPFCTTTSQTARDYLIWDDNTQRRLKCENIILFDPRERWWEEQVPVVDDSGKIIGYETITKRARFNPAEVAYIKKYHSNLLESDDVILFNNYFYIGSSIAELEALATYLEKSV